MHMTRCYDVFGLLIRFRVLPEEVGGHFTMFEALVPKGLGAPLNIHAGEAEAFRVLEGEFEVRIGAQVHRARPGDALVVPDGAAHAFTCVSETPGRLMVINAPGQMILDFFRGVGTPLPEDMDMPPAPSGPPDMAMIMQVAQATGMVLLPQ